MVRKKTEELPMKWNWGREKFEPELPMKKGGMKKVKINWLAITLLILAFVLILMFSFTVLMKLS